MNNKNPTYQELKEKVSKLEAELIKTKWLHEKENNQTEPYIPFYGDVNELNTERTILDFVGKENLKVLTSELMDLLDTSVAIYEKNGDYAFGMFNSAWCRFMDSASRKLCNTEDNKTALNCGKWMCHEDCWNSSAKPAILSKRTTDIDCIGGIKLYGEPIIVNDEVIGVINMGYGNPPIDDKKLKELSGKFSIDFESLKQKALDYNPRPNFIIEIAKKRLKSIAKQIGEIVRRKQAEQELEQQSLFISTLLDNLKVGVVACDANENLTYFNKTTQEFHGLPQKKINAEHWADYYDLYLPDGKTKMQKEDIPLFRALKGELFNDVEMMIIPKDGKPGTFLASGSPIFDDKGQKQGAVVSMYDINERKKADQALKESEERFKAFFREDKSIKFIINPANGQIIEANPAAKDYYGYNNIESLNIFDINTASPQIVKQKMIGAFRKEQNYFIFKHKLASGRIRDVEIYSSPMELSGEKVLFSIVHDITDRKKAEQALKENENRLKSVENIAHVGSFEINLATGKPIWSDEAFHIFELNPETDKEPAGKEFGKLVHKDDVDKLSELYNKSIETGQRLDLVYRIKTANNKIKYVHSIGEVRTDETGKPIKMLGTFQDITERKKAEQALKESEGFLNETGKIAKIGGWHYDVVNKKATWTKEMYRIHEVAFDFIPNVKNDIVFYDEQSKEALNKALGQAVTNARPYDLELNFITAKNNRKYVRAIGYPAKDKAGKVLAVYGSFQDITERKKAEQALKESEAKFKALVNNAADGLLVISSQNGVEYVSPSLLKITGYAETEVLNLKQEDIINYLHADDRDQTLRLIDNAIENKKTHLEIRYRWLHKKGHYIWRKDKITYEYDASGVYQKSYIVCSDITKEVEVQQALKESEEKLNQILDKSSDVIWIQDLSFKTLYMSKSIEKLLGLSVDEYVSTPINERLPEQSLLIAKKELTENLEKVKAGHVDIRTHTFVFEMQHKHKNGKLLWGEVNCSFLYDENFKPTGLHGITRDITERKIAEQAVKENELRLKSLVDIFSRNFSSKRELLDYTLNKSLILTKSKAGYIYFYDEQKEQFTLYTWSKKILKEYTAEEPQQIYNLAETGLWGEAVRQRKAVIVNDFKAANLLNKGAPKVHIEISNFLTIPVIVENKIVAVIAVVNKETDYTETDILHLTILMNNSWKIIQKIEAAQLIKEQNNQLQIANKQKDTFFQILAHDLRSPFSSLLGFSQLLMENIHIYDINTIEEQLGFINDVSTQTYTLLNDLLLWAKSQSDKLPFNPKQHNVKDIVNSEIEALELIAIRKQILIRTNLPNKLLLTVDTDMFKAVFRNLVSNAIKFTETNGLITISYQEQDNQNLFSVADTGVGIPENALKNLWENSELSSTEGTEGEKGTGFGLMLCKEFVEKHGGEIWAESKVEKGSTFYFTIPYKPANENFGTRN
jgi:PAS domain S-box-containing protein